MKNASYTEQTSLDSQVWGEHHVLFKERSQFATGLTFLTEMCKDHTVGKLYPHFTSPPQHSWPSVVTRGNIKILRAS